MHDESLAGFTPAGVGLRPTVGRVARHADVRVPPTKKVVELAVPAPDESRRPALFSLGIELFTKSRHQAGEEALAFARAPASIARAVLTKQAGARMVHEGVHVLGELEILGRAAHFEHAAAATLERTPHGHPNHLDEEMLGEDVRQDALALADTPARRAEVTEIVHGARRAREAVEVVLEHQALRRAHRRLRLVLVRALGQSEQLRYAFEHVLFRRALAARGARGARVDAALRANAAERRAVRRFVV